MRTSIAPFSGASRTIVLATAALAICWALSVPALGDSPSPERKALLDDTVRFLQENQHQDGGFAQGGEPPQGTSAWVALALAAAGINPRNQAQACGTDAYAYLVTHFREDVGGSAAHVATTAFDRELLVVDASGTDPHDFAGFDLVEEILARQLPDGSFADLPGDGGQINASIFAILALSPVSDPAIEPATRRAVEWLVTQQNDDGGWSWLHEGAFSEVDMTGAAIEALNAVGPPSAPAERTALESARQGGIEYLEGAQLPDGGFPALPRSERESNVASTAWAVQGIWSAGGNPETWRTGSGLVTEEPLDYMESMQQPDGHIRWSKSSDDNRVWMTAYVVPAFAGHELPIPEATYSEASRPPCGPQGGNATSTGVIAGGGGRGAPLFSRPKPQSRGETPGGARIVRNRGLSPRNHSRNRRGPHATQPAGTETAEPRETKASEDSEVTAVSSSTGTGEAGGAGSRDAAGARAGAGSGAGQVGAPVPATLREATEDAARGTSEREVSGIVIGDGSAASGKLAFGAPGLRSAGDGGDPEPWVAIGIGSVALLVALSGARWERRHEEVLP